MTDLISRADALEQMAQAECGLHYDDCEADNCSCSYIQRILDIPSAENSKADERKIQSGDIISRADAIEAVREYFIARLAESDGEWNDELQEYVCSKEDKRLLEYNKGVNTALKALPSADAVQGYTEWLEKIIVDNEGANEWLCEDTPDLEWCDKNCHYSSIQAECLRHLYEVSKGGDTE